MPDETELAWAAGFLDGEGHFGLNRVNTWLYPTPVIEATQSNGRIAPLCRLRDLFEGSLSGRTGRREWEWRVSGGKRLRVVLPQLLPYLCVKRTEASLLYAYALLVPDRGKKALPENRAQQLELKALIQEVRHV